MERSRSYRKRQLDGDALAKARRRAKHVIVLMLENRSFDQLLGRLDHPDQRFERVQLGAHPNPFDLADPSDVVTVTDRGDPHLPKDPPHGHVAAMTQLNRRVDGFGMDGFVTAYAQKIAGREHVAHVHWLRLGVLAATAVVPTAAAAHDLARRAVVRGWDGFAPWVGGSAVVVGPAIAALQLPSLPGIRRRYLAAGGAVLTVTGALAAEGLARWFDEPRGLASWSLVTGGLVGSSLLYARQKMIERAHVPQATVRRLSERVMWCMTPDKLPALAELARTFSVCTRWHSSVPGATWPNRNFAHAGTSDESVDIELGFYRDRTVFEALDDEEASREAKERRPTWRIYFHDTPQVFAFDRLWRDGRHARWFDAAQLLGDIGDERLPMYAFVEPCHTGSKANSQHPGNNEDAAADDFERGDRLIAAIYNALVDRKELFEETLLIVTHDEHGGLFDHVPPPKAVHPEPLGSRRRRRELARRLVSYFVEHRNRPFPFTHLGVRVPAVVVSPWVSDSEVDDTVYDHSSIVATIGRLWAPTETPLKRRDRFANDVLHLLVARSTPMAPQRCTVYDGDRAVADAAEGVIGVDASDLDLDVAARGTPVGPVLQRDDFVAQLDKLNHLVREELLTSMGDDIAVEGAEGRPLPTAALFKASAESTRNANPERSDV